MKPDIFIHYNTRLKQKSTLTIKNLKQRFKNTVKHVKNSIEVTMFYQNEIKIQLKVFRLNARNINRF